MNAIIRFQAEIDPDRLFRLLVDIETNLGRTREQRWAPRTVDLDILLFGQQVVRDSDLIIPHPRMSFRRFVLQPATQVAAEMVHPVCRLTLEQLLNQLDNRNNIIQLIGIPESVVRRVDASRRQRLWNAKTEQLEWTLAHPRSLLEFQELESQTKLVVMNMDCGNLDGDLVSAAESFRGSQLRLDESVDVTVELSAAMDAMTAI